MPEKQTKRFDELTIQLSQTQSELEMTATILQNNEAENSIRNDVIAAASMGLTPFSLFDMVA